MRADDRLREPWSTFLNDLDSQLTQSTEIHCLGGFVVSELYGLQRPTADVDILETTKGTDPATLVRLAGQGSELHKRHKVYLDVVAVATVPEHYESRLSDLFPERFRNLRLRAFERHDLVLAKLERNIDRDREDLRRIVGGPGLDVEVLRERYVSELRPWLGRPDREDLTLKLWLEIIIEMQAQRSSDSTDQRRPRPSLTGGDDR